MPDPQEHDTTQAESGPEPTGPWGVLNTLAGRLRSQPLVLALGILLLLAIVATTAAASLRPLLPYALGLFAIAVAVWLAREIIALRAGGGRRGYDVAVSARDVAKGAEVGGVMNAPGNPAGAVRVRVKAEGVKGSVSGVTFGEKQSGTG